MHWAIIERGFQPLIKRKVFIIKKIDTSLNGTQVNNYGETFEYLFTVPIPYSTREICYQKCEFFGFGTSPSYQLQYTNDCANSFTIIPIDEQYVYGQQYGVFPDVFRGGLPGEVYIDSWFPWYVYKASFSADTGKTFRHVYVTDQYTYDVYSKFGGNQLLFMSDREPGVFYILHLKEAKDTDPAGWHLQLCIEYYRDYGETLVDTYCHDVHKDWVNEEEEPCEPVNDLVYEKPTGNSVLLTWSAPKSELEIKGYSVFRNSLLQNSVLLTDTVYLDENLPNGNYEYFVIAHYTNGCVADSSNHVKVEIDLGVKGVKELGGVILYPNPTTGELQVMSDKLQVTSIEIFDVYGRKILVPTLTVLQPGIYFVRVVFDNGSCVKKLVKQ